MVRDFFYKLSVDNLKHRGLMSVFRCAVALLFVVGMRLTSVHGQSTDDSLRTDDARTAFVADTNKLSAYIETAVSDTTVQQLGRR